MADVSARYIDARDALIEATTELPATEPIDWQTQKGFEMLKTFLGYITELDFMRTSPYRHTVQKNGNWIVGGEGRVLELYRKLYMIVNEAYNVPEFFTPTLQKQTKAILDRYFEKINDPEYRNKPFFYDLGPNKDKVGHASPVDFMIHSKWLIGLAKEKASSTWDQYYKPITLGNTG